MADKYVRIEAIITESQLFLRASSVFTDEMSNKRLEEGEERFADHLEFAFEIGSEYTFTEGGLRAG